MCVDVCVCVPPRLTVVGWLVLRAVCSVVLPPDCEHACFLQAGGNVGHGNAQLLAYGSYRLRVHTKSSDIDACVFALHTAAVLAAALTLCIDMVPHGTPPMPSRGVVCDNLDLCCLFVGGGRCVATTHAGCV